MNLAISHELEMIRETVRGFVQRHLAPLERQVEEADAIAPETRRELRRQAVALGIYGYNMPVELGGPGLSAVAQSLINEELGATTVALAQSLGHLPGSLRFASVEQRAWLLPPLMDGTTVIAYALTEPDAGSDLNALRTRARRTAGGWVLNGSKQFISDAENADHIIVLAVTDPDADLKGRFTTFLVDRANPGLRGMMRFNKMGWRGAPLNGFALDQCLVPDSHVLGEPGQGFRAMMATINHDRLRVACKCVGLAQRAHDLSRNYARERVTFGAALADHQAIQFMIADTDTELEAARMLAYKAASLADDGAAGFRIAACRAKLFASEMVGRAADRALQILGGAGFTGDWPIERIYRDARAYRLGEGTSEMQRLQIARYALSNRG